MRVLAIEQELKPVPPELRERVLREEAAAVWALQKAEVIRQIWFTRQDKRAVIELECAGEEAAERDLRSLPLVQQGFIRFDVYSLRAYDGFDRLHVAGTAAASILPPATDEVTTR